jgi:ubiquinone/menaquinone biosynthesis C-methylase UbiE
MADKSADYKEQSRKKFEKMSRNFYKTPAGRASKTLYTSLIKKLYDKPFETLLDVGCGTGNVLSIILNKCNAKVSGIDLSEGMIEKARELLGDRADLKVGDSENLPWDNDTFDAITCNASFHHYPNPKAVLNEMKRVLKPSGRVIIVDPWMPYPIRIVANSLLALINTGDVKMYSQDEMTKMFENCGFESINVEVSKKFFFVATAIAKK